MCRKCIIRREDLIDIHGIPKKPEWTEEVYDDICDKLEKGDRTDSYGLRERCLLNELEAFHAVNQMPFDCLHDFFERVAQFDGQSIIMAFVKSRAFSLQSYNEALKAVNISSCEAKPMPVMPKAKKLAGKAMSIVAHVRVMPVAISMIGNLENVDKDVVALLCLLHKLNEFMQMEVVAPCDAASLQELLVEFFSKRRDCVRTYGTLFGNITSKYHFLEHYAEQLHTFGPFKRVWTGRMESKHRDFVNYLESSKNFINVPQTLAVKHQKRLASLCYSGMFKDSVYKFPSKLVSISDGAGNFPPNLFNLSDLLTDTVAVHNTVYKVGYIVVLKADCENYLDVGVLLKVVLRGSNLFFLTELHKARKNSFDIFETVPLGKIHLVPYSSLVDHKPLFMREEGDNFTFVLHHRFPGRYIPCMD